MTPADVDALVALVERWQQAKRAVDALDYCDDALDREEMEAEGDLLAWTFPPPTDTPPEIQVGDVVTSYRGPRARLTTRALARQREQCITERIRTSPSGTPEQTCREAYPDDRDHPTRWCVGCQLAAALDEDRRS